MQKIEDGEHISFGFGCALLLIVSSAVYAIVVRGSEYDLTPDMLEDVVGRAIANIHTSSGTTRWQDGTDEY